MFELYKCCNNDMVMYEWGETPESLILSLRGAMHHEMLAQRVAMHERAPMMSAGYAALEEAFNPDHTDKFSRAIVDPAVAILAEEPGILPNEMANRCLRALQAEEIHHERWFEQQGLKPPNYPYPRNHEDKSVWSAAITRISADPDRAADFASYISYEASSNVPDRGIPFAAVARLNGKKRASAIEIGASQMLIFKKMMHPGHEFGRIAIVKTIEADGRIAAVEDIQKTERLRELIKPGSFLLGPSIGIDLYPPTDPDVQDRAEINSFYPDEWQLAAKKDYDELIAYNPEGLAFYQSDFSKPFDFEDFSQQFPDFQADIVYFATSFYQLRTDWQRQIALQNAKQLANPRDGLIIVQDFVSYLNWDGGVILSKQSDPYTYNIWVYHMAAQDLGFVKYFTAEGGRVKKLQIAPELGQLAVKAATMGSPMEQLSRNLYDSGLVKS